MTESDAGSILVGQRASRKFGGPEIYNVAKRALTAGEPGNRIAKRRVVMDEGAAAYLAALTALSCSTIGHVCTQTS